MITGWVIAGCIALTLAVGCYMALTASGRDATARLVERIVSDQIPGSITIGRIDRIGSTTIASDLVLLHPDGREVLRIDHAAIDFYFPSFLRADLGVQHARVEGGRLALWIGPDGRSSIEAALDAPATPRAEAESPFHYWLYDIQVRDLLFVLSLAKDADTYRVHRTRGTVEIWRERGVVVALRDIAGDVAPKLAGMDVRVIDADGWVHGEDHQVMSLDARAHVGDGTLRAKLALFDRKRTPLKVSLDRIDGTGSAIAALLLYAKAQLTDTVDIHVDGT